MKKLFLKLSLYGIITFVVLEVLVRVFHLYSETPLRYIDEFGVEKRIPNQIGTNVTGNRRQHVTDFRINENGFNTIRKEIGSNNKFKIALVGDSFIEGFHQDYKNSLGRMIEQELDSVEVYEYGCGGYDMADQLHMINAYRENFDKMDMIIIYLKYDNDLGRANYTPNQERIANLNNPLGKIKRSSKLLSYAGGLGLINKFGKFLKGENLVTPESNADIKGDDLELDQQRIFNFKNLISIYGFANTKTVLLFDRRKTSEKFIDYCNDIGIKYIDFAKKIEYAEQETTLVYDPHWNSYGRALLAKAIANYMISR